MAHYSPSTDKGAAGWVYHLGDALGSVRQLADADGEVVLDRSYRPYGGVLESGGSGGSAYGFAGEWTDGTGLVHLRARYLDPTLGRFLTRDPWNGDQRSPFTFHSYAYALADPVKNLDPFGLYACQNWPQCFIIYLTGVGEDLEVADQRDFLDHLEESLDATVIQHLDPFPTGNVPAIQVYLSAYIAYHGETMLAMSIDQELTKEGAGPLDVIDVVAWSGGTQMALGAASGMRHHVDHVVLLGGAFRANENQLANIGQIYDLFGEHDPIRDPGAQRGLSIAYQWDRHNHGWRPEYCGGNRVCEKYHPELDLYATGRIRAVSVPGSDHMGYFASPDFVVNRTGLCQSSLHLPIQLRD